MSSTYLFALYKIPLVKGISYIGYSSVLLENFFFIIIMEQYFELFNALFIQFFTLDYCGARDTYCVVV